MKKHQIPNTKQQMNLKSQALNLKYFEFRILNLFGIWKLGFGILIIIIYLILGPSVSAQEIDYPISQLGNCRDQKECKLYCDVPAHTPACWSYGKYVMSSDILGESTVNITYPIAELGNCNSAQECFLYCAAPKNQEACISYAKNNGLVKEEEEEDIDDAKKQELIEAAKTELGCNSKTACMALCNNPNNMDKCRTFAQKHGLDRGGPPPEVMQKAKAELGCDSETSCMNFCQNPQNQNKCFEFAKRNGMMREEDARRMEEMMEKKKQMMEAAKTELGCESFESCSKICADPANREKCMNMGRKFGMVKEEIRPMNNMQKPCTSEEECKKYCESHPEACPGFNQHREEFRQESQEKMREMKGEFLGPAGCKTEEECKAYCEKHPDECPGFPKKQPDSYPTTQTKPMTTPMLQYQPYQPLPSGTPQNYQYNTIKPTEGYQQNYSPTQNYTSNYPPPNPTEYQR